DNRNAVEPRKISRRDENQLEHDRQYACRMTDDSGPEISERNRELHEVREEDLDLVIPRGQVMEVPAQGSRKRLRYVVVSHAGVTSPALVPPGYDQPWARNQSDQTPPQKP